MESSARGWAGVWHPEEAQSDCAQDELERGELPLRVLEPLEEVLEAAGKGAGEVWLCCLYCERFFQAKHLRVDYLGNRQGCAFCRCAGFNIAIHAWDAFSGGEGWPASAKELHHGMRMP